MAGVQVYGHSDDLLEVDGDIEAEFSYQSDDEGKGDLLAFSDGTVLRIQYSNSGVWRVIRVCEGTATFSKHEASEDDEDDYSDRVTLMGDIKWCVHGIDIQKYRRA